jgi:MFS family permease
MSEHTLTAVDTADKGASRLTVRRAWVGGLYGLLTGTAFVLMSAFIDIWLHPNLPLGVDWSLTSIRWILIGLGLALIGALTCLFNETWTGLLAGAITTGLIALTSALFFSATNTALKVIVLVFTLVPMAVMSLPIAWILRLLTGRHAAALYSERSMARIAMLIGIAVALGAAGGYFMKMPRSAATAVRYLHDTLQSVNVNETEEISKLPGWQEHAGMRYELFQKKSEASTEGYNVRAEYKDGYSLQCTVVAYPGSNPYLSSCASNKK